MRCDNLTIGDKFKMGKVFLRLEAIEGNVLVLASPAGGTQRCGVKIAAALLSPILETDRIDLIAEEQYVRDNGGTPYQSTRNISVDGGE